MKGISAVADPLERPATESFQVDCQEIRFFRLDCEGVFTKETPISRADGSESRVLSLEFKPKTRSPRREAQNLAASAVRRREA